MTPYLVAAFHLLLTGISCQAALSELDSYHLKLLNEQVSTNLSLLVVNQINDSIDADNQKQYDCAILLNQTVDRCTLCKSNSPPDNPPPHKEGNSFLKKVMRIIYGATVSKVNVLKDIAKTITSPEGIKLLGKKAARTIVNRISSVAENIESSLFGDAISGVYHSVGGLGDFGDNLASLTSQIENVAGSLDHLLTDQIEGSLSHVGTDLVGGVKDVLSSATDVANSISSGAKDVINNVGSGLSSISHSVGHIFGRKRSACPDCDKINSQNEDEIVSNVCGSDFMIRHNNSLTKINHTREILLAALNTTIIQKVEYDTTSVDFSDGVQFHVFFITYTINGTGRRYRPAFTFRLTDIQTVAVDIAMQIYTEFNL